MDSGRNAPYLGEGVRNSWNRRLLLDGILPLLIPAIEKIATSEACNSESIFRLTREIEKWLENPEPVSAFVGGEARRQVCRRFSWACRWLPEGIQWQAFENKKTMLEIPDFGENSILPMKAMPSLEEIAGGFVLIPDGYPRLAMNSPESWTDEVLARVMVIEDPSPLFDDNGAGLKYFCKFLDQRVPLSHVAIMELVNTVRRIFSSISLRVLEDYKEFIVRVVSRIPAKFRRGLRLGGNWPDETRRAVCAVESEVLLLPEKFDYESDPGTGSISVEDGVAVLQVLANAITPGRNTNPAVAVVQAASDPQQVVRRTAKLRLWIGQRLDRKLVTPSLFTVEELQVNQEGHARFIGSVNDWLREVSNAVDETLVVFPSETCDALLLSDIFLQGDLPGIIEFISQDNVPNLRSVKDRVTLFRSLTTQAHMGDLEIRWRWGVRYLLHGNPDLSNEDTLFLASGGDGTWNKLATATGEAHRILPNNGLTELLNSELRTRLGIQVLDQNGIAQLLREIDLHSFELSFSKQERDEILRGLQDYPDLIRDLPLHDLVSGGLTRLTADSYWVGDYSPGTLSGCITQVRYHHDKVMRAIQNNAHSKELTLVELLRLALRNGPAGHTAVILAAFAKYGDVTKEERSQLEEILEELKASEWLPLRSGRHIAPANVLHDDELNQTINDTLRHVDLNSSDPVSSTDLADSVFTHPGFQKMVQRLCPSREKVVSRLAGILKADSRFIIGDVDLRDEVGRTNWLKAFHDAPPDVMLSRKLIEDVHNVAPEICVSRLLPVLREGNISSERFARILQFLRGRHEQGVGNRSLTLRIHNDYLRLAAMDSASFKRLLPKLRLLSETEKWEDPENLCNAQGVDPSKTLHVDQQLLLRECIARQVFDDQPSGDPTADYEVELGFEESAGRLNQYFQSWRNSEETAGWAGAFLSLLGDYEPILNFANEYLEIAQPGFTHHSVRRDSGMRDSHRPARSSKPETPLEMMRQQRVLFQFVTPGKPLKVVNLLGGPLTVEIRLECNDLFVGYGMDYLTQHSQRKEGSHVRKLTLRWIDAARFSRTKLRELVKNTGELLLRDFYGQEETHITFGGVLEQFSGDDAFGIRVAQESFLNGAQYSLPLLGLGSTQNQQFRELLRLADSATNRRAEENVDQGRHLPGESAQSMERGFREDLQDLITSDSAIQAEVVTAVRRKLREFRYEPRSVLFELFQNADDACIEADKPIGEAKFLLKLDDDTLCVFHNGRPINRSASHNESAGHLHDLRKMLALGHSDKGIGPSAANVTGRFGLGFKSVFLLTDRPRIASGRLAFEVLGGVYPMPIGPDSSAGLRRCLDDVGLSRDSGTVFELRVPNDDDLQSAINPFYRLAHILVAFARRVRTVRSSEGEATWTEEIVLTTEHAQIAVGNLHPFEENVTQKALVIRCGKDGDLLFRIDESGFIGLDKDIPSIWVTAPTTEQHQLGYLANAPLDLDVGRCQVTWDSKANLERLWKLGESAGDALIALFDKGTEVSAYGLNWDTFWNVIKTRGKREELREELIWGEHGAARRLYANRKALPTGLKSIIYSELTSLSDVRGQVFGLMSRNKEVFQDVSTWDSFQRAYPQGSLVDESVGKFLPSSPFTVTLVDAVRGELEDPCLSPDRAEILGRTITRERLNNWYDNEVDELRGLLKTAQFQNSDRQFDLASKLLAKKAGGEEEKRAAFAPPRYLLSEDYNDTAVKFFLVCRGPMIADAQPLADWVTVADTEKRKHSALRYLSRGELGPQVLKILYEHGFEETWLKDLSATLMNAAGLSDYEQGVIKAGLGQREPAPRTIKS